MRASRQIPPARSICSSLSALRSLPAWPDLSPRAQDALKVWALLSMLGDHANRVLNPYPHALPGALLEWFGRLAFPLLCLLIAHNLAIRHVDWRRYLAPLLAAGLLAQVPFAIVINPSSWNVMFTLALGVIAVAVNDYLDRALFKGAGAFGVLIVCLANLWCDYPVFGCALIPLGVQLMLSRNALWWLPFIGLCLLTNLFTTPAWIALALPVIVFGANQFFPVRSRRMVASDGEVEVDAVPTPRRLGAQPVAFDSDGDCASRDPFDFALELNGLEQDALQPSLSGAGRTGAIVSGGIVSPVPSAHQRRRSGSPARLLPRWFAYAFYPAHLFALLALSRLIAGRA